MKTDNYTLLNDETLLSTGNGYVGMRANFEEGYKDGYKTIVGTYINGFYDTGSICYDEQYCGFPLHTQKMVNVHNAQGLWIHFDNQVFNIFEGNLKAMHRELNIKKGYAIRKVKWQSKNGHNFEISFKRMASFTTLELMTIEVEIKSIDFEGEVKIVSRLESTAKNEVDCDDPRSGGDKECMLNFKSMKTQSNTHMLLSDTVHSNLSVATACSYSMDMEFSTNDAHIDAVCTQNIKKDENLRLVKYIAFTDSIRHEDAQKTAFLIADEAAKNGIDYYYSRQEKYLDAFWQRAYIHVDNDEDAEYALNYSIYQLLSSAGRDEHCNIGAKGLSGSGYHGHYFWDTEIYMIPFFTLTMPDIAKNLLKFRYNVLEASKNRSIEVGHKKGAKIPWRTISGGECSSYYPAGSAQYHINADIAYAYIQYYLATGDIDMIMDFGYEVIFETARIWLEVGNYNEKGQFCINTVTGPDEYTALINNNYYTNSMAKYHLEWVIKLSEKIKNEDSTTYAQICDKLCITEDEIGKMQDAARSMLIPYSKELNIHLQDDSFLNKKEWDFENTPKDKYPLLLNYHPMHIYRHQVLKQADTILSYMLLDNVDDDTMLNSYNYYRQRTTHDSSLSPCVHSIVASRLNKIEDAYKYFMSTLRLDLDDINKNTKDGLHIANAGGAYMAIVYGFGGLRIKEDGLHLKPTKPNKWNEYSFTITYQSKLLKVNVGKNISLFCKEPMDIYVYGEKYNVHGKLEINIR